MHLYNKAGRVWAKLEGNIAKNTPQDMSELLNKASSLLGIWPFICGMNSRATQEETNKRAPRPCSQLALQAERSSRMKID